MDLSYRELGNNIIKDEVIRQALEEGKKTTKEEIEYIINKAGEARGLTLEEVAKLLVLDDPELEEKMFRVAREIKERIYGNRIVLFAPLYISNYCVNHCVYCGYNHGCQLERRKLTMDEIREEVKLIEEMGHKRIALEAGEDDVNCPIDYILEAIDTIYDTTKDNGSIRRINVNIAATTVDNYRKLKQAGIGTYVLFQETYHKPTYERMHPKGPKHDYYWHLTAMDRAMQAGIDDVGIGALFGLYDYRYEVLGLIMHSQYLDSTYGVGPHTISVPRLRPAAGMKLEDFPYVVSDEEFKRIVAILRLAVPYTGIILSTREKPGFREEVIALGVSQISAGSCTGVGGYREEKEHHHHHDSTQFEVEDHRTPEEIINILCDQGYIPSYCTACYRQGRTGERFMRLAKSGQINNVCLPNALLTFKEYLLDYAGESTREKGNRLIQKCLEMIPNVRARQETVRRLERIEKGERDLYF